MPHRIAVCDDDAPQAEALKALVSDWAQQTHAACAVDIFPSAEALQFADASGSVYDVLLLDVEMSGMNGIALARQLRACGSRAEIIFVTSHFEYVGEGYEVDALHDLVKPVAAEKLFSALSRAAARLAETPPFVLIACEGETIRLFESDILFVESFLHDIVIHTRSQEYRIRENISAFAEQLSADFFRVHRSYLVNLKTIVRIGRASVTLTSGVELPLARGKYDAVNRAFIAGN